MNARENPFASKYIDGLRYRFLDADLEQLLHRLAQLNYKAAIIGPHGTGKTTLLEELGRVLENKGFHIIHLRFNNQKWKLTGDLIRKIKSERKNQYAVLIDGMDQLSNFSAIRLNHHIRNAGAVVVTSHITYRFPTLIATRTTPELLSELIDELLGKTDILSKSDIHKLFHSHGGNIRDALRELYDLWAEKG